VFCGRHGTTIGYSAQHEHGSYPSDVSNPEWKCLGVHPLDSLAVELLAQPATDSQGFCQLLTGLRHRSLGQMHLTNHVAELDIGIGMRNGSSYAQPVLRCGDPPHPLQGFPPNSCALSAQMILTQTANRLLQLE
jgi:hypothetical protein